MSKYTSAVLILLALTHISSAEWTPLDVKIKRVVETIGQVATGLGGIVVKPISAYGDRWTTQASFYELFLVHFIANFRDTLGPRPCWGIAEWRFPPGQKFEIDVLKSGCKKPDD